MGLKSAKEERHDGPRDDTITLWGSERVSQQVDYLLDESAVRTSICQLGM